MQELEQAKKELEDLIEIRKYDLEERAKDHLKMLDNILDSYIGTVNEQARRKPDTFMRPVQIRLINELLSEFRSLLAGTEAEDYLHLAEEPQEDDPENHPGTTYGEMAILLGSYNWTVDAAKYGHLYWKDPVPGDKE